MLWPDPRTLGPYGSNKWIPNNVYYIWAPSIDAEEPGQFSRQIDDWDVWNWMPTDNPPPGDVTDFRAMPGDSQVVLSWKNPTDSDFKGTLLSYSTGSDPYPITHNEGAFVCDREAAPNSSDSSTVIGLDNCTKYNFSAFTYDEAGNYSETAHIRKIWCHILISD